MGNKIAVIGSNSFSGASFVRTCLEQGRQVLGISRSDEPVSCFLPYRWLSRSKQKAFHFERCDINSDHDRLMAVLDAFQPSIVVNFAAQGMVAQSWQYPLHWYQTNVMANVMLHEQLRRRAWLGKYVHVGTPEVYGSTSGKIDERAPFNPSTPYAASRAACDLHLRTFLQQYKFPVVWTRSANVYGQGQQLYRIIPRTILCIRLGERLNLQGGGLSIRSFIHIADVAEATIAIADRAPIGETYHISTDRFISIRNLVEMICRMMGADFASVATVTDDRPGKDAAYILDSSKLRTTLCWQDRISLELGISETIDWLDHFIDQIRVQPRDYLHRP